MIRSRLSRCSWRPAVSLVYRPTQPKCLPPSCEPAAIQSLSACRAPGKGRTSQRNPAYENKEEKETKLNYLKTLTLPVRKTNRITTTLLSSFLASTSKVATLLSLISSALIYNKQTNKKISKTKHSNATTGNISLLHPLSLTVIVPFPAGVLFFKTRGLVSFLLDTT